MLRPAHGHGDLPPAARELLVATAELLDDHAPEAVTTEMVLTAAEVDADVLATSFADLQDLVRRARVLRFTRYVDESITTIAMVLQQAQSREELREWLHKITVGTQAPERAPRRLERASIFGAVAHDDELRELLAAEQRRLTDSLLELVAGGQGRGWISLEVDPYSIAVLVQAYTLGRSVDDVTGQQMDPDAWIALIMRIVDRVMLTEG